ncbi:Hypothetical protein, putative [Bodo saltans]|uniref:TRUD domain-containing protein n=1 Tax=Bodo saltans TaxID=75058 RepID=A0A0S4JF95_BODSA|nr:Hypothetical protein, putative [Bodo saltans]|eukprot:CUG90074.1 Hypothetical protein, putative [Bodo saltans]
MHIFFFLFFVKDMQRSGVWCAAPSFLGLKFSRGEDADFTSQHSRKAIENANKLNNMHEEIDLWRRQRLHDRQTHSEKFHIRCFARPSQKGFQSRRISCGDLRIQEHVTSGHDLVFPLPTCGPEVRLVDELLDTLCKEASKIFHKLDNAETKLQLHPLSSGSSSRLFSHHQSNPSSANALHALVNGSLLRLICRESNGTSHGHHWRQLFNLLVRGFVPNCEVKIEEGTVVVHLFATINAQTKLVAQHVQSLDRFWSAVGDLTIWFGENQRKLISNDLVDLPQTILAGVTLPWLATLENNAEKQRAIEVMEALDSIYKTTTRVEACSLHLVANRSFLQVNWQSPPCTPAISTVVTQNQEIIVAEFVLEKVGLPHEFVIQDITEDAQNIQWTNTLPNKRMIGQNAPVLTHSGAIDATGHTFQRCRIRGLATAIESLQRISNRRISENVALHQDHLSVEWSVLDQSEDQANMTSSFYCIHNPTIVWRKRGELQDIKQLQAQASQFDLKPSSTTSYKYDVTLKCILPQDERIVLSATESMTRHGFLNYFGPQRFGPQTFKGMHPGLHLLKEEYQAAAFLLIKGSGTQEHDTNVQRALRQAIAPFDGDATQETASDEVCCDAFHNVLGPSVVRSLVQEFLVFVWNEIVSHRIVAHGNNILEGDIVRLGHNESSIHFITPQDIVSKRWKFADVLLPIPGAGIELPRNKTREIYQSTLRSYGILFDAETSSWPIFGSGETQRIDDGTFVNVLEDDVMKPSDECWDTKVNVRPLIRGGYRPIVWVPRFTSNSLSYPPSDKTGSLKLSFELPLGVYPSMLVRELTKFDVAFLPFDDAGAASRHCIKEKRLLSLSTMKSHDRGLYQKNLNKKRKKNIALAPMAIQQASLHQKIFRSGGMRRSLLPSTRGRDDVSK